MNTFLCCFFLVAILCAFARAQSVHPCYYGEPGDPIPDHGESMPLTEHQDGRRFEFINNAAPYRWTTTATFSSGQGRPDRGQSNTITWGFVPDGTAISGAFGEPANPSNLTQFFNNSLPIADFTSYFADWSSISGLTFVYEPNDDGAPIVLNAQTHARGQLGVRADIRIGGHRIDGNSGTLAYAYSPGFGDIVIDTADNTYATRPALVRNVIDHEVGHALGLGHSCPVNGTKLMEPMVSTNFVGPTNDEKLGIQFLYGDILEDNDDFASSVSFGTLSSASIIRNGLSLERAILDGDFFSFVVGRQQQITITVSPVTGSVVSGLYIQNGPCNPRTVDLARVFPLSLQLFNGNQTSVVNKNAGRGAAASVSMKLNAGATYFVKVWTNTSLDSNEYVNRLIQLYNLNITATCSPCANGVTPFANCSCSASAQCTINSDCGNCKVCRQSDFTCQPAASGSVCGTPTCRNLTDAVTSTCNAAGACVTATTRCASPTAYCSAGVCRQCADATHCTTPAKPVCLAGTCSSCSSAADCSRFGYRSGGCVSGACIECDSDGDGVLSKACGGTDCNDTNATVKTCSSGSTITIGTQTITAGVWQTITMSSTFNDPIVITALETNKNITSPLVIRMRNLAGNKFDVMAANQKGTSPSVQVRFSYTCIEAGTYTSSTYKFEAYKFSSTMTANKNNNFAQFDRRDFAQSYTNPVVIGSVMSNNNNVWSTFWSRSKTSLNTIPVGSDGFFYCGKHIGEDTTARAQPETIGYVVIESTGSGVGTFSGLKYKAAVGAKSIQGAGNAPPYTYNFAGLTSARFAAISQTAVQNNEGSWAVLWGPSALATSSVRLAVDEDNVLDAERSHPAEYVSYLIWQ